MRPTLPTTRGFSLIELLIAMALGVVLLLGLIQMFDGVRSTFNAAEAKSRIQENGRFALEFLRRDARMAGHTGCLQEQIHFPAGTNRLLEPNYATGLGTGLDYGFYNHLLAPGAAATRDNAPYVTQINRGIEVYNFAGTSPGESFTIASDTPAVSGNAGNWTPTLPSASLGNIANLAIPGSDIVVFRYFEESPLTIAGVTGPDGVITLGSAADAASVQQFGIYGLADCRNATLFQTTAVAGNTVTAAAGGLNIARSPGTWFSNLYGAPYTIGSLMSRLHFVVYYVGLGTQGPALMRMTIRQDPATAAQGITLGQPEEVIEGVEMMQVLVGVAAPPALVTDAREAFVDDYFSAATHLNPTTVNTPALLDQRLREISSLRVSLLIRGNNSRISAQRTLDIIVVGDINVQLPVDGRSRQTYDTTLAIRNRLSS